MRVLIIDDEPTTRMMQELSLVLAGHEVHTACNGLEGLVRAAEIIPDVVVLDVMMPDLDGHEVAQFMREIPALAGVPIVFCTSLSSADAHWCGYRQGASSYLAKPVRPEVMASELARVTG